MSTGTVLIILTQALILGLFAGLLYYRARFQVDLERVAGALAAKLLEDYRGELHTLDESGTRQYFRERYIALVATFGLPGQGTDWVVDRGWAYILEAQKDWAPDPNIGKEFSFYG